MASPESTTAASHGPLPGHPSNPETKDAHIMGTERARQDWKPPRPGLIAQGRQLCLEGAALSQASMGGSNFPLWLPAGPSLVT